MFNRLRKWISGDRAAANDCQAAETTVVYLRLPAASVSDRYPVGSSSGDSVQAESVGADLAGVDSTEGEITGRSRSSRSASRRRSRRQAAVRFARRFSKMTPREALCLMAIHRRQPDGLANESPALLKRDLERYLWSSRGQRHVDRIPSPDLARVRRWIEEAQQGR